MKYIILLLTLLLCCTMHIDIPVDPSGAEKNIELLWDGTWCNNTDTIQFNGYYIYVDDIKYHTRIDSNAVHCEDEDKYYEQGDSHPTYTYYYAFSFDYTRRNDTKIVDSVFKTKDSKFDITLNKGIYFKE